MTAEGTKAQPYIELRNVSKRYGATRALEDVSVRVDSGLVHALVGENGAGKSTLEKMIGGIETPSEGTILLGGEPVSFRNPRQALAAGIAVIQQEPALVGSLTVAQNVVLGDEDAAYGVLRRREARRRFEEIAERAPFGLDPDREVEGLPIAEQQKVEITRALARDARLIVMDEPTSALGRQESEALHEIVRQLCREGRAVVYVSHFLEEIVELADRFTILRNGRLIETIGSARVSIPRLVKGMLGEATVLDMPEKAAPGPDAPVRLGLKGLRRGKAVKSVDLEVRAGEIVALAGLVGSGRTEVARMVVGADRPDGGSIELDGEPVTISNPRQAIRAGIGFVPEDRGEQGLLLDLSQRMNVTLPHVNSFGRAGVPNVRNEKKVVLDLLGEVGVDPLRPERSVRELSGGNQQKVLFARWLIQTPSVLVLDEPTRGVDIGAKWTIYNLIVDLARRGLAILLISSEIEEVVGLAHRVVVMRRGEQAGVFEGEEIQADRVMHSALGVEVEEQEGIDRS